MKLGVITSTTRQGRKSDRQVTWALENAKQIEGAEVELIDLRDYDMPFFDEPISPRYNPDRQLHPEVKRWLEKLDSLDAYLFVTAEYNHDMPAVLKNALDYVDWQFVKKPAAVISHGSAGGARAMTVLKEVLSENKAILVPTGPQLAITNMLDRITEDGSLTEAETNNQYGIQGALEALLTDLKWYSDTLAAARA